MFDVEMFNDAALMLFMWVGLFFWILMVSVPLWKCINQIYDWYLWYRIKQNYKHIYGKPQATRKRRMK